MGGVEGKWWGDWCIGLDWVDWGGANIVWLLLIRYRIYVNFLNEHSFPTPAEKNKPTPLKTETTQTIIPGTWIQPKIILTLHIEQDILLCPINGVRSKGNPNQESELS